MTMFAMEVSIFAKNGTQIDQWCSDNGDLEAFKETYERRHKKIVEALGPLSYTKRELAA